MCSHAGNYKDLEDVIPIYLWSATKAYERDTRPKMLWETHDLHVLPSDRAWSFHAIADVLVLGLVEHDAWISRQRVLFLQPVVLIREAGQMKRREEVRIAQPPIADIAILNGRGWGFHDSRSEPLQSHTRAGRRCECPHAHAHVRHTCHKRHTTCSVPFLHHCSV